MWPASDEPLPIPTPPLPDAPLEEEEEEVIPGRAGLAEEVRVRGFDDERGRAAVLGWLREWEWDNADEEEEEEEVAAEPPTPAPLPCVREA